MSLMPLPGQRNGIFESIFGGARPRAGTPPFAGEHPQTGGANVPTTPETLPQKRGLAGFLDRAINPTNALGQFGQALVMAGGGQLGNAVGYMAQQRQADRKARAPKLEQIGNQIGMVDSTTGRFTPTYTAPQQETGFRAELRAAGIDPDGPDGQQMLRQKVENAIDPFVTFNSPDVGSYYGPRSGLPGAIGMVPPVADPSPASAPPAGGVAGENGLPPGYTIRQKGGGVSNGTGGFRVAG